MPSTEREAGPSSLPDAVPLDADPGAVRPARVWAYALAAGLVAALVSWLAGEACLDVVQPRRHAIVDRGMSLSVSDRRGEATANALNAGLAFILLGASLGAAMGAAGSGARGSSRPALRAAVLGAGAGAIGAGLASLALLPAYDAYRLGHPDEASRDLMLPLLVHVGVWGAVGAAGGLGLGLGLGDRRAVLKVVIGGLVGAAIGAVAFEVVGAFAMPAAETSRYVSRTASSRLFARLAVCLPAAAGAVMAVLETPGRGRPGPA